MSTALSSIMQTYYDKKFLKRISEMVWPFGSARRVRALQDKGMYSGKYTPRPAKVVGYWATKEDDASPVLPPNSSKTITFTRYKN